MCPVPSGPPQGVLGRVKKNDRLLKSDTLNLPSTRKQRKLYPRPSPPATHTHPHPNSHQEFPPHPSLPQEQELESSREGVGVWVGGQGPLAVECGHHGIPEKEQKAPCLPSPEQSTRRKSGHSALGFSPAGNPGPAGPPASPPPPPRVQLHVSAGLFG